MPPKKQITKEIILEKAFAITKEFGFDSISARTLAKQLDCSTQPIYQAFTDMDGLKTAIIEKSVSIMLNFIIEHKDPTLPEELGFIIGYVQFANLEKQLFALLFSSGTNGLIHSFATSRQINFNMDMIIYANGMIMMSTFHALNQSWEEKKSMLIHAYELFCQVQL